MTTSGNAGQDTGGGEREAPSGNEDGRDTEDVTLIRVPRRTDDEGSDDGDDDAAVDAGRAD